MLRYKRAALASLGYEAIMNELYEIEEACSDVHWFFEDDGDGLLSAMDGDEDEVFEFKMAFSELEIECERLSSNIRDQWDIQEYFDDCTVALIGNRFNVVGFDTVEEDYFGLCAYEQELATTEAGRRVTRWTKAEMLSKIGHCMGITVAFLNLRERYDYLKATMDILRNENASVLKVVREIETAYNNLDGSSERENAFDKLLRELPDRAWIE